VKDIPKPIKKALREYAGIAYEAELRKELEALSAKFDEWKASKLDNFDLTEAIHKFHNGPARELYKKYNYSPPLEVLVAHAIVTGLLKKEDIRPDVLEYLSNTIAFYEKDK
jgi:hypothetical protein